MTILDALYILILAIIHLFENKIAALHSLSRCKWLSLAGGISVAFVFVHLLPELHKMQKSLETENSPMFINSFLYILALAGVLLFYGLEKVILKLEEKNSAEEMAIENDIFWLHVSTFAAFNIIIGYYFHNELEVNGTSSFLTFIALGFHFLINDYSLLQHHKKMYDGTNRWIMAGAVVVGWLIGAAFTIPDFISSSLFALLTGAIVVNSFKEELPEDKESHFGFFVTGAIAYTILLNF